MNEIEETSWHSYPKVYNLGHPAISDLFTDDVIAEEKVDGSQFSFGRFGDEIRVKSHKKMLEIGAPEKMFAGAIATVVRIAPQLGDGWTYRGEVLAKPKHNVLAYDRIPRDGVILFDVNTGHERYLGYDEKAAEAARLGLEVVPLIYRGRIDSPAQIVAMLERVSVLGGSKIEGVVLKNYGRFSPDGKAQMGKHVSEAFKEVKDSEWQKENPARRDILATLCTKYHSEARWNKAIIHLAEDGRLENDPRDIGNLMRGVQQDIEEECSAEIAAEFLKWAMPFIRRYAVRGLPEWYKAKLVDRQFKATE